MDWRRRFRRASAFTALAAGGWGPAPPRILPAELERSLEPFHVLRGFTLEEGLREHVGIRGRRRNG